MMYKVYSKATNRIAFHKIDKDFLDYLKECYPQFDNIYEVKEVEASEEEIKKFNTFCDYK